MKKNSENAPEQKEKESVWTKGISVAVPLLIFLRKLFPSDGPGPHWFYLVLALVLLCGMGVFVYRLVQKLRIDQEREFDPLWQEEQLSATKRFWPIAGNLLSAVVFLVAALFSLTVFLDIPLNDLLSGQVAWSDVF